MFGKEKSPPVWQHEGAQLSDSDLGFNVYSAINSNIDEAELQGELDTRFKPKKVMSLMLSKIYEDLDMVNRAYRVSECGSYLEWHVTGDSYRLARANFCKDRLCPMCNWRRSLKIFSQVSRVMNVLEQMGFSFLFLTLTVKNCSAAELPDTVQMLFDGWKKLYHGKAIFKDSVVGTFRSFEVTRNPKTGYYHPHIHAILAVRPDYFKRGYISQVKWSELWRSCCDLGYNPIVDVRRIKTDGKGIVKAVAEVAKYAVKDTDVLVGSSFEVAENVVAFLSALSHRRLCSFTGCFGDVRKQLALDYVENGNLVNVGDDELRPDVAYAIVRYQWRTGTYVKL